MNDFNLKNIKAVCFDIDGTLYRAWKLNFRMSLFFIPHCMFFLKYGLVRNYLRKYPPMENFKEVQADLMAKKLHCTREKALEKLDKIVYSGLSKYFDKIKPCKGAFHFIKRLKDEGYKIGLLSDFPPEQKGEIWGIRDLCDVILGSEDVGALKPEELPFRTLGEKIGVPTDQILFVGNSHEYDVLGSKKVGMKAAWILTPFEKFIGKKSKDAEITFCHYDELEKIFFNE